MAVSIVSSRCVVDGAAVGIVMTGDSASANVPSS